jgi:hypothetical protein
VARFIIGCLAVCGISGAGYYAGARWGAASHSALAQAASAESVDRGIGSASSIPASGERSPRSAPPVLVALAESSAGATSAQDDGPREIPAARRAPVERTEEERRVYASAIFDAEPVDTNWARATQRDLAGKLRELAGSSSRVQTVDCRNTLCRVELSHDNGEASGGFLRSFMRSHAWSGNGMAVHGEPDPKGRVTLTLYLAREGAPLPEAEPE